MNILDINPRLLLVFVDLCKTSSITKTSENLGLSQPSTSRHLATLREVLKDPLFVPAAGGIVPTPAALRILPSVEKLLLEYERLPDAGISDPAEMAGVIRIATTDYGAMVALGPALTRLNEESPNLTFEIFPLDQGVFSKLIDGRLDFAFYSDDTTPEGIEHCDLFKESHVYIVNDKHPLTKQTKLKKQQIESYKRLLVNIIGDRHSYVDDRSLGKAQPGLWLPYFVAAPMLVAQSKMIMSVPKRIAENMEATLPIKILPIIPDEAPFIYRLLWSRQLTDDPIIAWVRDVIVRANSS